MNLLSKMRMVSKKNKYLHSTLRAINITITFCLTLPKSVIKMSKERYQLQKFKPTQNVSWFINVPSHANLGDQAMSLSIRRWLGENYPDRSIYEISRPVLSWSFLGFISHWKKLIKPDDIIFIQGGYTSSDKTPNEIVHRKVAEQFPNNRIVFFPQTAKYSNIDQLEKSANIYNEHGRIIFLARDDVSFNQVAPYFNRIKVLLYPDVATTLIGRFELPVCQKEGVLLCIREDSEKHYSHKQIAELEEKLSYKYRIEKQDLIIKNENYSANDFERIIKEMIILFSKHKVIVTDRFHGVILSMVAGTKVVALDSVDYKVREGAKMMSSHFENSAFPSDSIEKAVELVDRALQQPDIVKDDRLNKKYFSKLKNLIEEL